MAKKTDVKRACTCGASWSIQGNAPGIEALVRAMESAHQGFGHAPVSAKQAARVRYQLDQPKPTKGQ